MKIKVLDYPETFSFETDVVFPKFEYGCEVRGAELLKALRAQQIDSYFHRYEDYVVEIVTVRDGVEHWILGS